MAAQWQQANVVQVTAVPASLNVAALASDDGHNVTVRVVNSQAADVIVYLSIDGFDAATDATVVTLAAPAGVLNSTNPATAPFSIVPVTRHEAFINGGSFLFPAASFTVVNVVLAAQPSS